MLRRFASLMSVGAIAVTSYGVLAAAPAAADPPNDLEVTKVVVGEHKGVGYEVVVTCDHIEGEGAATLNQGSDFSETLTFPPEGGTEGVDVDHGQECTIVETHNGGATHTTVEPSTCVFPENNNLVQEPQTCEVTVTNTFEKEEPVVGPAGPPGPPGECPCPEGAAAARPVTARARFTG